VAEGHLTLLDGLRVAGVAALIGAGGLALLSRSRRAAGGYLPSLMICAAVSIPLALWAPRPLAFPLLVGGAMAFGVGVAVDELGLTRGTKILAALLLAGVAALLDIRIQSIKIPFLQQGAELGDWSYPVTVLWLAGVTYAVVVAARVRGVLLGVTALAAACFVLVTILGNNEGNTATLNVSLALFGAATGGFYFAWPPARAPLAAPAWWALSFWIAAVSVIGAFKQTAFLFLWWPLLVFGLPLVQTGYALLDAGPGRARLRLGAERRLLHEALLASGVRERALAVLFLGATAYLCAGAMLLTVMITVSFLAKFVVLGGWVFLGLIGFMVAVRLLQRPGEPRAEVAVLDVPVDRITMDEVLARIGEFVASRTPHLIVTSDSLAILRARRDREYHDLVHGADLVLADGAGVVLVARMTGQALTERVTGVDLTEALCRRAAEVGWRVFLLGSAPGVADEAARRLHERYPRLVIAGTHHGYFPPTDDATVAAAVRAARPEVLFVGMGSPRQEKWIRRHQDAIGVPVAMGVGGTLDVLAGRVKRAPAWMQRLGLEWFYRTVQEPTRLRRVVVLPWFLLLGVREAVLGRGSARAGREGD